MHTVLIDDNFISLFLSQSQVTLAGYGAGLHTFQLPEEALQHVLSTLPDAPPNIILLDLNMPLLSGWEFLEALEPHAALLEGRCFVFILTSSLAASDTARSSEFPLVAGLIHKPLDLNQIHTIYHQVAELQRI